MAGYGGAKAVTKGWLRRGDARGLYIAAPARKALPAWAVAGDVLSGEVRLPENA